MTRPVLFTRATRPRIGVSNRPWVGRAACRGIDPDVFFPDPATLEELETAKNVCRICPVQVPCLEFALANAEAGVWGGTSEAERDRMRGLTGRRRR